MSTNAKFNLIEAVKIKVGKSVEFDDVSLTNLLLVRILARLDALEKTTGASLQIQLNSLEDELAAWVVKNFVLPTQPWSSSYEYIAGSYVIFSGVTYICSNAVGPTVTDPSLDAVNWTAV